VAEEYFAAEAAGLDETLVDVFSENGVEVVGMSSEDYQAWLELAQQSSYQTFADNVPNGQELIDAALEVE
jgi:TRAP-type C4-dicarboxylate transport system substrate-binding protein